MKTTLKKVFVFEIHTAKLRSNNIPLGHSSKPDEKMIIAHWTYSREEWKAFLKWKVLRKGIFHYLLHWLRPLSRKRVPEIRITTGKVWINNRHEPFHDKERSFRNINIHDAGKLNVMEIRYEYGDHSGEIRIPIPKGKLREAIQVQEELMKNKLSVV
jgi:hypothetical protein